LIKLPTSEVLDFSNESEMVDEIFFRIGHLVGAGISIKEASGEVEVGLLDPTKLSIDFRTVYLAYDVLGIVLNGGFDYLFEADYSGDPGYVYCAAALQRIGYKPAGEAFRDALAIFPGNTPPLDRIQRMDVWNSSPEAARKDVTTRFWHAQEDLIKAIASYIRANRHAFEQIPMPRYAQ
jgi:hypothetical protein